MSVRVSAKIKNINFLNYSKTYDIMTHLNIAYKRNSENYHSSILSIYVLLQTIIVRASIMDATAIFFLYSVDLRHIMLDTALFQDEQRHASVSTLGAH